MDFRHRQVRTLPLALLYTSIVMATSFACSSATTTAVDDEDEDAIEIQFPKMYSATTDGTRTFKVPAIVNGVKSVTWSSSDESIVDLEPGADGKSVTILPRKAGTVSIIAKAGSLKGTATLVIEQATEEEWSYGNDRYNNGVALTRPERGDGGPEDGRPQQQPPDPSLACTNCHAKGKQDVEHTPMQTAGYSDEELIAIFTEGRKPEGASMRIMKNEEAWSSMHQWSMETEEVRGIVVYLRSLEPESQGDVDFGGRREGPPPQGPGGSQATPSSDAGSTDSE